MLTAIVFVLAPPLLCRFYNPQNAKQTTIQMSFRAPLLRARLPQAVVSRHAPLTTFSRALPAPATLKTSGFRSSLFARTFTSSPISKLEASLPLGDGGIEEAPHSGINVDKPVRMDT